MAGYKFFLDGTEYPEPLGWDAIQFTAKRLDSHGIDQPFTTEIEWDGKAAIYLKSKFDTQFINADIELIITSDVRDGDSTWTFYGKVNMALYQEHNVCDTDSFRVKVGIVEDDFRELFKSRQDVELDLTSTSDLLGNPIDELTFRTTRFHTQELFLAAKAETLAETTDYIITSGPCPREFVLVMPFYWQNSDFKSGFGNTFDPNGLRPYADCNEALDNRPIFVNNGNRERRINFNLCGSYLANPKTVTGSGSPITYQIRLVVWEVGNYAGRTTDLVHISPPVPELTTVQVDYQSIGFVDLPPNYAFNFIIAYYDFNTYTFVETDITFNLGSVCNIWEANADSFASLVQTLTIEEYLRRLIYIITGNPDGLISDTFSEANDGCYWNNILTNGLRIRNAQPIEAYTGNCVSFAGNPLEFKASWKKAFEALDKIFCLGWAFEQDGYGDWKIRVEKREYFYQPTINFTALNVGEIDQVPALSSLVNNIIIGYTDTWKNIALSGQWAIHTERSYFIDNRAMEDNGTKKLDLRSEFIGEGYTIEFYRRMQQIKDDSGSSDRPCDNETFIVWLNRFTIEVPNIESSPFGLPDETGAFTFDPGHVTMPSDYIDESNAPIANLYNIYHTPARIACRWWVVLGSYTYGLSDPRMRFQYGEYFTGYSSRITGQKEKEECIQPFQGPYAPLAEDTDIYADLLNDAYQTYLFKPIEVRFDYPQDLCSFLELSNVNQYGRVRVKSGSLHIAGYIQEIANQPNDNSGGVTSFFLMQSNLPLPLGNEYSDDYSEDFN